MAQALRKSSFAIHVDKEYRIIDKHLNPTGAGLYWGRMPQLLAVGNHKVGGIFALHGILSYVLILPSVSV